MRTQRLSFSLAFLSSVLALLFVATPPDASGAVVPFVVATLLVAALALVAGSADIRRPAAWAIFAWHLAAGAKRVPARQCDPDAAGHVRSRAPGCRAL